MPPESPSGYESFQERIVSYRDNGFRVVVATDSEQSNLRMELRYTVGSGSDPEGKAGLAHVVEHLMHEIPLSDAPNADTYSRAFSRIGSYSNAFTTQDATSYISVFPKTALAEVFALEVIRIKRGCRGLAEAEFARAREIVRNEARERSLGENGQIFRALEEFLYVEGHPYRTSVLGTDASISSITVDDVCGFIERNYHPKNTIIVVSGDVREDEVRGISKRWFRSFPSKVPEPTSFPGVSFGKPGEKKAELDVGTPYLFALWPLKPKETDEHDLQRQVRYGLAEELQTLIKAADWGSNAGIFIMGGAQAPALVAAVELRTMDDVAKAKELVRKAREQLLKRDGKFSASDYEYQLVTQEYEDVAFRTTLLANYEQHRNAQFGRDRVGRKVPTTKASLHEAASRLLKDAPERFLIVDPKSNAAERKVESFQFQAASPTHESLIEPDAETIAKANEPLALPETLGREQEFRRYKLPNGLNLILWQRGELPLVYGRLVVPSGAAQVPQKWAGLSELLAGDDDYDATVFSGTVLSTYAHVLAYSLAESLRSTKLVYSPKQLASLRRSLERKESRAALDYTLRLKRAIYGESHPYASSNLRIESFDALTKDAARKWTHETRSVDGATLLITGRFEPELMYKQVLYYFRDAPSHRVRVHEQHSPTLPSTQATVTMVDEDMASLKITLVYRGGRGVDSTQPARDLLTDILNDELQRLREEQAVTYGIRAQYLPEQGDGVWLIAGSVDAARSAEAMGVLRQRIAALRADPKSYVERFATARERRMHLVGRQKITAAVAAARLTYLARLNLEDDYFENYVRALAQTTPADVARLFDSEFETSGRVLGLVGPSEAIRGAKAAFADE